MASLHIPEPLRFKSSSTPPSTAGAIADLAAQLELCDTTIDCWPRTDSAAKDQRVLVFEDHTEWFAAVKARMVKKSWHPDQLRCITADMPSALRLAGWIRSAQHPGKTDLWRRGEYIRTLDPIHQQGQQVAAAGAEFKITTARELLTADTKGPVTWSTPARGEPRSLELAIAATEVQALRLEPLAGGDPIVAMAELPRRDFWRTACNDLKKALAGAKHLPDVYGAALEQLDQLQQQVIRVRSAAVITPELISNRRFAGVAVHPDLTQQYGDGIHSTQLAVAAATTELLVTRQDPFHRGR